MGLLDDDIHAAMSRRPRMRRYGLLQMPAADYASGGIVRRRGLLDPDPPGPDQGFAALRAGERVLNERQWRMLSAKARTEIEAAFKKTAREPTEGSIRMATSWVKPSASPSYPSASPTAS